MLILIYAISGVMTYCILRANEILQQSLINPLHNLNFQSKKKVTLYTGYLWSENLRPKQVYGHYSALISDNTTQDMTTLQSTVLCNEWCFVMLTNYFPWQARLLQDFNFSCSWLTENFNRLFDLFHLSWGAITQWTVSFVGNPFLVLVTEDKLWDCT